MQIYNAVTSDVKDIHALIQIYAEKGLVLPRSLLSIYQHLQCMYVVKEKNKIVGVAGLHILGHDLGEIRSLVVSPDHMGKGIGRMLVNHIINEASRLGVKRLISFTYQIEFFKKCGFEIAEKETLPEKVWIDCVNCPKLDCCDETAMIKYIV
ncbi:MULTISPECIES: N-acetyltransferase [Anoxybacillus]|jgi:amino-acid N-acetyltransferase|uniref:Amino-acid acetyltransferase n=3 Tax=Anoxybacillus TaxID=150247 RepID=A0A0D0HIG1_9BACL|nr:MULTISPECIES: N-acetyltransferase [Anoxybacillus]AST05688.1 GNAT family N-acetyltransferase [Anoxybacillus flavithermus]AXM88606.1 GNAT family N-acetyltransferase [Anoxybacillus ayderensis G10]ACJ32607.1 Acetyltransferase (GNAT family) [Anoxybacillus flavithermus WK1]KIP19939.1 Amino-acid acetyltransferase [Anoxybacillus ayderensis]MBB6177992.1 amino-acid N-acetyltransferase [Anoxybacillus tengchongensis]